MLCNQTNWWARCHGQGDTWPGSYKSTWDGNTGSFCHSAKHSVCVCPIYRCRSLCSKIKPCQSLNQSLIRGVIKANSSFGLCVVCLGAKHAQSALEGAGCSHCERLSLRTLRSLWALFEEGAQNRAPSEVVETILQSRAPSTRKLYGLKWNLFTSWCRDRQLDPVNCPGSSVLEILQARLSAGLTHSTLKVYVAAITTYHAPLGGQSVGRHLLVTRFFRGALRLRPPLWSRMEALCKPPFEPFRGGFRSSSDTEYCLVSHYITEESWRFAGPVSGPLLTRLCARLGQSFPLPHTGLSS